MAEAADVFEASQLTTDPFDDDKLHEECGVFGVWGGTQASAMVALGLHALQHRGQEACGIASVKDERFYTERHQGLVGEAFGGADLMTRMPGRASAMPSGETLTAFAATGAAARASAGAAATPATGGDLSAVAMRPAQPPSLPCAAVSLAAGMLALGSVFGGYAGARVARLLPDPVLRGAVIVAGVAAAAYLFVA